MAGGRVTLFYAGRILTPHKGNDRVMWCVYGKVPTRQLPAYPLLSLEVATPEHKINSLDGVILQARLKSGS